MLALLAAIPGVASVYSAAAAAVAFLLRCTPCLIAIAIAGAWIAGDIHGHRKESAQWSAKWKAAEEQAELDRLKRDAFAKATMERNANDRIAGVSARAEQLEAKVQQYEKDEGLRRATGGVAGGAAVIDCLTDQSDDRWLSDIRRGRQVKPAARGGLAERLRARLKGSPDPGKR